MNVTLEWTAKPAAGVLHVEYTLTNKSDKPLYAVDDMLEWQGGKLVRAPKAIIVRNGAAEGTASLFRGNMNIPTHDSRMYPSPGARLVAAGTSVQGTADVPLPLKAWHNYHPEKMEPLKEPITQLVLEIQIVRDLGVEGTDWKYESLGDGSRVQSPYLRVLNQRGEIVRGSSLAAPP